MQNNLKNFKEVLGRISNKGCHLPMVSIEEIRSVVDFYTNFCPNEEKAKEIFEQVRWGDTLQCPYCKSSNVYRMNSKVQPYKCGECKRKYTVKTGSILQNSKTSVQQWLYAIYVMKINTKGISSLQLSRELGITQKSAWYMLQKIRKCFLERASKLEGIIEMDETFIGGKEGNKHRNKRLKQGRGTVGKTAVMGAIQRDNKRVIAYPVKTVNTSTVGNFIDRNIENTPMLLPMNARHTTSTHLSVSITAKGNM